jgi:hypothetical protein
MTDEGTQERKIIIDEDWKSQVQAEKEALARQQRAPESGGASGEAKRMAPLPAASLTVLITMLATQATIALGAIVNPATGKPETDLEAARHMIDLLQVLEDKTQGNRTPQETALLSRLLDELRLGFVEVQRGSMGGKQSKLET